jgi:hypothetical protein
MLIMHIYLLSFLISNSLPFSRLSRDPPSTTLSILYVPCARRVQNIACQALYYFEVFIQQGNIRYGSCVLDSYLLDRSFQIHFACKLDGFDKNRSTTYKEET